VKHYKKNLDVFVGFDKYPLDGQVILNAATVNGNRAIDFECHVWAVDADQKTIPPAKYIAKSTDQHGKIE